MNSAPVVPLDTDEYWADPYPILKELRDRHRTAVTPDGQKVVLRWDDAEAVKKRPEIENEGLEVLEARGFGPGDALYEWRRYSMSARNGEDHKALRSLVTRALTPRSADRIRPVTRAHTLEVLERHADAGELDARWAFREVPFRSIVAFLGIGLDEANTVGNLAGDVANAFGVDVTQEIRDSANQTMGQLMSFVGELVESRRSEPRDDLLTRLIQVEEDGVRLSHDELVVLFTNIFGGALETTHTLMTSTVLQLARHPEQRELLRARPEEMKRGAVEETLRYRPGFYATGQKATAAIEVAGLELAAGEPLSIIVGGPNRDPSRWHDPDRFEITRDPSVWSFTFSMGPHFCLGQAIARAELQEFASLVATCCLDLELTEEPAWQPRVMLNVLDKLPVRYRFRPATG